MLRSLYKVTVVIRKFNLARNQLLTYHYLHGAQLGTCGAVLQVRAEGESSTVIATGFKQTPF